MKMTGKGRRPGRTILVFSITILTALTLTLAPCAYGASGVSAGTTFTNEKTGSAVDYQILKDCKTVRMGDGSKAAVSSSDQGTVFIPKDVTYYKGWEDPYTFCVTQIAPNAFKGRSDIKKVKIEADVTFEPHALDGLAKTTIFETSSLSTKKALLAYGIPLERVIYKGLRTKYVAFGDSIAAGYALPEYVSDPLGRGDALPTPKDAFVSLVGAGLEKSDGPSLTDNQAASGWTSQQLLDCLKRGDYDSSLADADVITVTIGSNDLLGPFIEIIEQAFKDKLNDIEVLDRNVAKIIKIKAITKAIPAVIDEINSQLHDNQTLLQACKEFRDTIQPAILAELKKKAPSAELYWTTLYNPFAKQTFDLKALMPGLETVSPNIWNSLNPIDLDSYGAKYIKEMNKAFNNSSGYHVIDLYDDFDQAGLTNVQISHDSNGISLNFDPHPNTKGHKVIADLALPVIQSTYASKAPAADLSNLKNITAYSLSGNKGKIDQASGSIAVTVPYGTDIKALTASFQASKGALVTVGGKKQVSGKTVHNFTKPVTYDVTAEDGTMRSYKVKVAIAPAGDAKAAGSTVNTGDEFPAVPLFALALGAAMICGLLVIGRRRN
ncbi:GDSL-type esterase/lipase family protein [Anaerovorax odorimutans]|uniref:GDSL-type esterase/lipase family protein n=1 Tax=Anaerovorax odorimutans TaxID=109327 RepID=A0ABT1RNX4_9FIRM|nr:GDSL-type esterase/lipase family protein [Anaerovorax odorimutans]MCQ4636887.1 GDSL-type esterase/lipase family protein [Anaerovorax odorimutans]